jgi:uncharacterized protein YjbJ (UPF0337 family)
MHFDLAAFSEPASEWTIGLISFNTIESAQNGHLCIHEIVTLWCQDDFTFLDRSAIDKKYIPNHYFFLISFLYNCYRLNDGHSKDISKKYLGDILMTNAPSKDAGMSAAQGTTASASRQIILKEIGAKWGKFSEQNLSELKGKDDLVAQVVEKYGLEKGQARRDVDALLKGRQI